MYVMYKMYLIVCFVVGFLSTNISFFLLFMFRLFFVMNRFIEVYKLKHYCMKLYLNSKFASSVLSRALFA